MGTSKQIQINSFDELIEFIQSGKLDDYQVKKVLNESLKVWFGEMTRDELVEKLETWWKESEPGDEKPLFLD